MRAAHGVVLVLLVLATGCNALLENEEHPLAESSRGTITVGDAGDASTHDGPASHPDRGARAAATPEPDAARPNEPDAARPNEPDAARPNEPDAARPNEPDAARPNEPDAAPPNEPDAGPPNDASVDAGDAGDHADGGGAAIDCTPDTTRCADSDHQQRCSSDGAWSNPTACPFVCSASTGACGGECKPGAGRCFFDSGLGRMADQSCDADGHWSSASACCYVCNTTTESCGADPGCNSQATACPIDPCASQCARVPASDVSCAQAGSKQPYYWHCTGTCQPSSCGRNGQLPTTARLNAWPTGDYCSSCDGMCDH